MTESSLFPLGEEVVKAFVDLKMDIEKFVLTAIDETVPFALEADASEAAIVATSSQAERPVAFFSRSLKVCERDIPAAEKEALAICEAVRH